MANNTLSDDVKDDTSEGHSRIAFILLCSGLVFLMTPGIALYYSAMLPARYSTRPLLLTFAGYAVVMVQWYLVGFSLALSPTGGPFIGDFKNAVGSGSLQYEDSGRGLSDVSYSFFQLLFHLEKGFVGRSLLFTAMSIAAIFCQRNKGFLASF